MSINAQKVVRGKIIFIKSAIANLFISGRSKAEIIIIYIEKRFIYLYIVNLLSLFFLYNITILIKEQANNINLDVKDWFTIPNADVLIVNIASDKNKIKATNTNNVIVYDNNLFILF